MKKLGVIFFILICFLFFGNLILGANLIDNVDSGIQKVEDTKNKIDSVTDGSTKWDYLGNEWKAMFLKNKIISVIDSSLTKVSFIFEVLIGEGYTFSIAFFFMILVWFYLLFNLNYLSKTFFCQGGISWSRWSAQIENSNIFSPFISVNCILFKDTLIPSFLFKIYDF